MAPINVASTALCHPSVVQEGRWGWMVVLAGFVQSSLVFGVIRSFGVFFVEFVAYFGDSSSAVSWVISLGVTVLQFASPVSSALSTRFGARPLVMVGGFLASLGLLLASFSTSLAHLYLTVGLVAGFGWGLVFTPTMATVSQYFEKRRTLATGLAVSGAGISALVFSPFFQFLVDLYGWRGAMLLVAGMSLNLVLSGAVLRPVAVEKEATEATAGDLSNMETLASLFALELLHHGPFMRYVFVFILVDTGYFVPYAHLIAHARETGRDEYQAALVAAAAAIADTCGRIFAGWFADTGFFGLPVHHLTLWTVLTGISLMLMPLGHSYTSLVAISACYGFFAGALVPLQFSSLVEIVGSRYVLGSFGFMHMLESIGALLGTPLSGWLRDTTGDYGASFVTAGAFLLAGGLVLTTLPGYFSCSRPSRTERRDAPDLQEPEVVELGVVPQHGRDLL